MRAQQAQYVQIELVVPRDHGVVGASLGRYALGRRLLLCVWQQHLPPTRRRLQRVEVKGDQVVEEEALDLTSEYVDLGAEDVQGMSVAARRTRALG